MNCASTVPGSASFYKSSEGRPQAERLREQEAALRAVLAQAAESPAVRRALEGAGLQAERITLADLARLPLLRKEQLPVLQAQEPPFGGWLARPLRDVRRIFISPGPIYEPEDGRTDYWGFAPALHAAGFASSDVVVNTFSYHLTPAGAMFDGALAALGCVTIPSGVGNLEIQVKTLIDLKATGFIGTPGFLSSVLVKIGEQQVPSPLRVAFVSGEPLAESLRRDLEARFHLRITQGYATGDLGLIAYECPARTGLHLDDRVIVEIVDPHTGVPVPDGEVGEVAVTFLSDLYPLLRLATGDLSRLLSDTCSCGRTSRRLERILGRASEAVKVRGIFLYPYELDAAMARHPDVVRYQAVVTRPAHDDDLTITVESKTTTGALEEGVIQSVREITRLRSRVEVVAVGTLPSDARKLVDQRTWD